MFEQRQFVWTNIKLQGIGCPAPLGVLLQQVLSVRHGPQQFADVGGMEIQDGLETVVAWKTDTRMPSALRSFDNCTMKWTWKEQNCPICNKIHANDLKFGGVVFY